MDQERIVRNEEESAEMLYNIAPLLLWIRLDYFHQNDVEMAAKGI